MSVEIVTTKRGLGTAYGTVEIHGDNPLLLEFSVISEKRVPLLIRLIQAQECDMGGCTLPNREGLGDLKGVSITFKDSDGRELTGDSRDKSYREFKGAVIESVKGDVHVFEDLAYPDLTLK